MLYSHHVDVVLSGHNHVYERYALQTPAQTRDPKHGIRESVVGTGDGSLDPFTGPSPTASSASAPIRRPQADAAPAPIRLAVRERTNRVLDSGETDCH